MRKKCSYFTPRIASRQAASRTYALSPLRIHSAVILLPHKDCFPPSGAPGAEYSGNAP